MTDSMKVYEWEADSAKDMLSEAVLESTKSKGDLYCTAKPNPGAPWSPRLTRALASSSTAAPVSQSQGIPTHAEYYRIGGLVGMESGAKYKLSAYIDLPEQVPVVRVFRDRVYSPRPDQFVVSNLNRTSSFVGVIGDGKWKLLGPTASVLNIADGAGQNPRLLLLDTMLDVQAVIPGLSNATVAMVSIRDSMLESTRTIPLFTGTDNIHQLGYSPTIIPGIKTYPMKRVKERRILAKTGYYIERVEKLNIYSSRGSVYCKVASTIDGGSMGSMLTGLSLYELKDDNFILSGRFELPLEMNMRKTDLAFGLGEQALFQYRCGLEDYWLINDAKRLPIELPLYEGPFFTACLAPDGSVLYDNPALGLGLWDSTGTVAIPKEYSLSDIGMMLLDTTMLDTVKVERPRFLSVFHKLLAHCRSHLQGQDGGECLLSHPDEFAVGCISPYDNTMYSLINSTTYLSLGREKHEMKALGLMRYQSDTAIDGVRCFMGVRDLNIEDTRYNEVIPVAKDCALLRRSSLAEDGFGVVVGNVLAIERQGYAASIGNGMILTNHRTRREFERYPVTPSAILHMLDVDHVYGKGINELGPRHVSRSGSFAFTIGRIIREQRGVIGLVLLGTLGFLFIRWWIRRQHLPAA